MDYFVLDVRGTAELVIGRAGLGAEQAIRKAALALGKLGRT